MSHGKKQVQKALSKIELSAFCTQISMMISAAIPLDEGLYLMAEDGANQQQKKMYKGLAEEIELGALLYQALERLGGFPDYLVYMAQIGEESGNLDQVMEGLAEYYKKEDQMAKNIRDALTYPVVMIFMMLIILFILMTKVMPVFEGVFVQLGTELSPLAKNAVSVGGIFSGGLIAILAICVILFLLLGALSRKNIRIPFVNTLKEWFFRRSKISITLGIARFCHVVSMMLRSGMDTGELLGLAKTVAGNRYIEEKIDLCEAAYEESSNFVQSLKQTGFFQGFNQQMLVVGSRTGHMDQVLHDLSDRFSEEVDRKISGAIAKFEPTMIAVLSVAVGLILLAVMLPLIGMMAAMG